MIFYTLSGPTSKLEIHNDRIKLMRNPFLGFFWRKDRLMEFKLDELALFTISEPKSLWGKIEWASEDGNKASFHFTTNAVMMSKIEKYMHTLIAKNEKRKNIPTEIVVAETKVEFKASTPEVIENNVLPFKPKAKKAKLNYNKKKIKNRKVA